MDWQQVISLAIVAAAAGFLLRRTLRRRRFPSGCGAGCACPPVSTTASAAGPSVLQLPPQRDTLTGKR